MNYIKSFGSLNKNDTAIAGGKGASLGEMTQASISVPPGFVVLSDAFEKFLKETDLNVEINAKLQKVNHNAIHTVDKASKKIQVLILRAEMPKDIADEIKKEFKKLKVEYVAVRSSATAEDSSTAAWAGQLETYLNTTEENLLENVKKCWASLFTPRAIFYRFEQKLHKEKISVAIIVQKMVESKISGIAFSVHPVTQDRNQMIIEAGLGLGESIVSGQITPDGYVVEKEPRNIIDTNINVQKKALVRSKEGGNKWIDLPKTKGEKQVLSDRQIIELSDLVLRIEQHYNFPQDIEWVYEKGKFYITQSRPITTLPEEEFGQKITYKKYMNRSMSVMACQCWYLGEKLSLPKSSNNTIFFEPMFIYRLTKGVGIYYDYSDTAQDPKFLVEYFSKNTKEFYNVAELYEDDGSNLIEISKQKQTVDFSELFKLIVDFWGKLVVIMELAKSEKIDTKISKTSYELRKKYETVLYQADELLLKVSKEKVPSNYTKYIDFLTFEEIKSGQLPEINELRKRTHGYVFFKNNLTATTNIEKFEQDQGLNIVSPEHSIKKGSKFVEIKGDSACGGKMTGTAKVVFEHHQMKKVKNGDVLVTPMTTPDFLHAMKKSAAIITDEGGITCHAAIVSREMKKPCIIGTRIATQVLKNGDEVEVDANKGIVKILKKIKQN